MAGTEECAHDNLWTWNVPLYPLLASRPLTAAKMFHETREEEEEGEVAEEERPERINSTDVPRPDTVAFAAATPFDVRQLPQ